MGVDRFESEFQYDLRIEPNRPVPQKLIQDMHLNDFIIHKTKTDGVMRNVRAQLDREGRNNERKHPHKRNLEHEMVLWADVRRFRFGAPVTIGRGDPRPSWTGFNYQFPTDYFHKKYLPVVVLQMCNTPGLNMPRMTVILERVRTGSFRFSIHQLEPGNLVLRSDDFWLSILAVGRKGDFFGDFDDEEIEAITDVSLVEFNEAELVEGIDITGEAEFSEE